MNDSLGLRRRAVSGIADEQHLGRLAYQQFEWKRSIAVHAISRSDVVEARDVHQLAGNRVGARAEAAGLVDRRGERALAGRGLRAIDGALDAADERFALRFPVQQRGESSNLVDALVDRLRHVEELEAHAD